MLAPLLNEIPTINQPHLPGGLQAGTLSEWGMPEGRGGSHLFLPLLKNVEGYCAWIYSNKKLNVYPPAWSARGIDLERVRFVPIEKDVVSSLQPLWMSSVFKLVVIDRVHRLSAGDFAFLANQARKNQYHVAIFQPYFLSPKQGNVWARLRVNCSYQSPTRKFHVVPIKGYAACI